VNFWELHTEDIVSSLKLLPEIKQVSARKHWYNSITIETTEYLRIGYLLKANKYYPVLEDGTILSQLKENTWPTNAPLLFNWEQGENLTKLASEMKNLKPAIVNSISEIHYSPSQLDSWRVVLFMNEGYKVIANLTNFSENLSYYPSILAELKKENYPDGIIHLEVGSYFEYLKE
jgi:cell division protein FtsQ